MERYMYQDDSFERMLKQKADEYRMYPSDKTWASIQHKLQKPKSGLSWKAVPVFVTLIVLSITISNDDIIQNNRISNSELSLSSVGDNKTPQVLNKSAKQKIVFTQPNNRSTPKKQAVVTAVAPDEIVNNQHPSEKNPENTIILNSVADPVIQTPAESTVAEQTTETKSLAIVFHDHTPVVYKPTATFIQPVQQTSGIEHSSAVVFEQAVENKTDAELNYEVNIPFVTRKKETRQLQVYGTSSLSYRVLVADNKFKFGNVALRDPESQVTHHMALGWEAGAALLFPVTKKLKFRTGIQMNYTRYDVEAFKTQPAFATVRLNNTNVLSRPAALANETGLLIKEVANETYQFSIPVGVELNIAGGKKLQWNIAGNIQPSYLLKASGYLVTNDYKNYIKAPDLLSNVNLNTALETFFRWDAGSFQLQAGPQFRYQLFSNVRGNYPIKEHLVDYGFKIGFIKTLR